MEVAYRKQLDEYLEKIDSIIENGRYKDNQKALGYLKFNTWYKNAKFGVFLHWGVYSVPAYYSEWYPRLMYYKGNPVYWHHKKKYGKDFNYRDFVPMFKAEKFDAEKWNQRFQCCVQNTLCLWENTMTDIKCMTAIYLNGPPLNKHHIAISWEN